MTKHRLFLSFSIFPHYIQKSQDTPLTIAAGRGHCKVIQDLLEAGADANHMDIVCTSYPNLVLYALTSYPGWKYICSSKSVLQNHATALISASAGGHTEIVQLLLKAEANVNHQGKVYFVLFLCIVCIVLSNWTYACLNLHVCLPLHSLHLVHSMG